MAKYRLSNEAKKDLIQIHHFGVKKFGMTQADIYFKSLMIVLRLSLRDLFFRGR